MEVSLLNRLTVVAASTIASCVSELLHVTSKSSDEEKENFLARVKCPSCDLPLVLTDKCKISINTLRYIHEL